MKGIYPNEYINNPKIDKPIEEIWDDINGFTHEYFEKDKDFDKRVDLIVPLPPLKYDGIFTKGLFFTRAGDYILKTYPSIKKLFFAGAYSMCQAYPWCKDADVYFTCYENKAREKYYKNKYPEKKDKIFIPLQDADFTNEYEKVPAFNTPKTVDVLCVASPYQVKNHYMLAKAIKVYEQKYKKVLKVKCLLAINEVKKNKNGKFDFSALSDDSQKVIQEFNEILDNNMEKYVTPEPRIPNNELYKYYTSAKCTVLMSLLEGKNRAINESLSCDTPVVAFKALNQYAVGETPLFYGNSGELAEEFTPESLADAIHKVITNPDAYEPRKNYLKYNGRKNFINICVNKIPYYKENVPEYQEGRFHDNVWVDLAMQENYQLGFHDYLYGKNNNILWVNGIKKVDFLIKYYYAMFGIKPDN